MLEKRIDFGGEGPRGLSPLPLFMERIDITPRGGGGLIKLAGKRHADVDAFMRKLKPDPDFQWVLMTPMGSYEFFGANVNNDAFPESVLSHNYKTTPPDEAIRSLVKDYLTPHGVELPEGRYVEFGYKTFENALRYLHHVNKDPTKAWGDIPLSVWNPEMHRVEVIVRHDRKRAESLGAGDILKAIDEGRPTRISMGCKTPFDFCSACGNISRSSHDMCVHMSEQMGQRLPNGRMVCAINPFPRFFDLSDVHTPAAKESGVLEKLASARGRAQSGRNRAERIVYEEGESAEQRADKPGKEKETGTNLEVARTVGEERRLPIQRLLRMSRDPIQLLTTLAAFGIVATPEEFQYALLAGNGDQEAADALLEAGQVFTPNPAPIRGPCASMDPGDILPSVVRTLMDGDWAEKRSAIPMFLGPRIMGIRMRRQSGGSDLGWREKVASAAKISIPKVEDAYRHYRHSLLSTPPFWEQVSAQNEGFETDILKISATHLLQKEKVAGQTVRVTGHSQEALSRAYLERAHYTKE